MRYEIASGNSSIPLTLLVDFDLPNVATIAEKIADRAGGPDRFTIRRGNTTCGGVRKIV